MPEFILDGKESPDFASLPALARGYIEAAFFTAPRPGDQGDSQCPGVGEPCPKCGHTLAEHDEHEGLPVCLAWACDWTSGDIPESMGFLEIAPQSLADVLADCDAFEKANAAAIETLESGSFDGEQIGRDYWFTRNGYGVGYWDRAAADSGEQAALDALDAAARSQGEIDLYLGDDCRVYFS